ncbi:MAG: hypothetical protein AB7Q01_04265, partial [Gammaproteobacteria bacterium]
RSTGTDLFILMWLIGKKKSINKSVPIFLRVGGELRPEAFAALGRSGCVKLSRCPNGCHDNFIGGFTYLRRAE